MAESDMKAKEIKINLKYREAFERMKAGSVKKIIIGLMDAARGEEPVIIPNAVIPTFMELKSQLGEVRAQGTQFQLAWRPTEEQACAYLHSCLNVPEDVAKEEVQRFLDYYDERGWMIRGKAIKRWDNCLLGWMRKRKGYHGESIFEQHQADNLPSIEDGPAPF